MNRSEFLFNIAELIVWGRREHGFVLICFTFYRSSEDQLKEFEAGRSQVKEGKHQKWLAVDLCLWDDIDEDGKVDKNELRWRNDPRYTMLGEKWEEMGGRWGGRWPKLKDIYHFEG